MNYIRACFCIEQYMSVGRLSDLQMILHKRGVRFVGQPNTLLDRLTNQMMTWIIENGEYSARLFQSLVTSAYTSISFDVDSAIFLPGERVTYDPGSDRLFFDYEELMIEWISFINPYVGIIDYDADLLCGEITKRSLKAWGNYFSPQFLQGWSAKDKNKLLSLVDRFAWLQNNGLLVFNNPLGYSIPTDNERRFWELIDTH